MSDKSQSMVPIPSPMESQDNFYNSADYMRLALKGIYKRFYGTSDEMFIKGIRPEFIEDTGVEIETTYVCYVALELIIKTPIPKEKIQNISFKRERAREINIAYSPCLEEMRNRLATQLFRSLLPQARDEIVKKELEFEQSRNQDPK